MQSSLYDSHSKLFTHQRTKSSNVKQEITKDTFNDVFHRLFVIELAKDGQSRTIHSSSKYKDNLKKRQERRVNKETEFREQAKKNKFLTPSTPFTLFFPSGSSSPDLSGKM